MTTQDLTKAFREADAAARQRSQELLTGDSDYQLLRAKADRLYEQLTDRLEIKQS